MSTYVKSYGETKWIYFLIEDLLRKYDSIWDKVSADIKTELDSESVYNSLFFFLFFFEKKVQLYLKHI